MIMLDIFIELAPFITGSYRITIYAKIREFLSVWEFNIESLPIGHNVIDYRPRSTRKTRLE